MHYDEKHGIEIFAILPHSSEAQSHQLTHGRALNNSKHTSQLESTVRMYQGKTVSIQNNKRNVTEGYCIKGFLKTNLPF